MYARAQGSPIEAPTVGFRDILKAFNRSIPIKEVFNSGLRDLIRLLINIELF